jgi:hypothetical protein
MSSIGSISMAGLQSATAQFQSAAGRIANPNSSSDLTGDIVDAVAAKASVSISLHMIRAEQEMTKALVDILV